jgi:hypothetical protein
MADFLFQYRLSIEYFHDFDSYDYAKSAQRLDVELDPLLVAFNHTWLYTCERFKGIFVASIPG